MRSQTPIFYIIRLTCRFRRWPALQRHFCVAQITSRIRRECSDLLGGSNAGGRRRSNVCREEISSICIWRRWHSWSTSSSDEIIRRLFPLIHYYTRRLWFLLRLLLKRLISLAFLNATSSLHNSQRILLSHQSRSPFTRLMGEQLNAWKRNLSILFHFIFVMHQLHLWRI